MAKMFYTIEEVAAKLGKTEDQVRDMAASGQIQEFRDRDKLMFKVEQIDLLAGPDEDTGDVHLDLEDSSGSSGIALQDDSVLGLTDSREGTGISVFDTDHADESSEGTATGEPISEEELNLEAVGSGSGLLDLTRESDETSLGAELLEEVYSSEDNIEIPANASGLFEAAGTESAPEEAAAAAPGPMAGVPMVLEAYDGAGSGLGAGLLIGALVALVCLAIVIIVAISGATPGLAVMFSSNLMIWAGGLLAVWIIFGLVGLFIGKASE
ncbi:MAG: helix-turn-helix domain-containing protein [Phycisphaerales bacterium]|nr:MAG: helix-turn-helix domain-containing protein [Phycisphaerales bacterium]